MNKSAADLAPTYHDFSWLGLPTRQIEGIYAPNQRAKAPVIAAYILLAFARLRCHGIDRFSFAEMFCADGFYAMFAGRFGATASVGFDDDRDGHLGAAERISNVLGLHHVSFEKADVAAIDPARRFSVVANVGGLYHVDDPIGILEKSYAMAEHFLIVQTVVSLARTEADYFERPAPGWTWGNRFSRAAFDHAIKERGWKVVESCFNILEGNERPEDRGSVYYLIEKPAP
jgi:hypothetical protein